MIRGQATRLQVPVFSSLPTAQRSDQRVFEHGGDKWQIVEAWLSTAVMVAGNTGELLSLFFFQAEDGIRDIGVTGVQTCALPIFSPQQTMYHFLSGYTAKVAGTERGVTEPNATFSACFGAPFLPLHPNVYATLLGEKIARHGVQCWLVNTGWTGGPYGVGQRMRLALTRAMVRAALAGTLDRIPTAPEPVFGLEVPLQVPGVPDDLLLPRGTWRDPAVYDAAAAKLSLMFQQNFEQFRDQV